MTTTIAPIDLWSALPGWGIAADVTPPELLNSRHLKRLQKYIAAALVLLLAVCAAGYVVAARQYAAESSALEGTEARTAVLRSEAGKYLEVTTIQGTVTEVQTQIETLMGPDVDLPRLMGLIRSSLPVKMTIDNESVLISLASVTAAEEATPGSGLDTSGLDRIGAITVSGTATSIDGLSTYVDNLVKIPGIVDVVPTSNAMTESGVSYQVSLGLTTALLSHRFDVDSTGGK